MDKLIEALKKALIASGLEEDSKEFKKAINPENFEGIKNQLGIKLPTNLDEALKLPGIQSQYDKKITEATQTRENNLKEKWDFVEKGKGPESETPEQKRIRELEEKEAKREKDSTLASKKLAAEKLLDDKKIPKQFVKHFDFSSDVAIEEQLTSVESTYTEMKQEIIDSNINNKMPLGSGGKEVSDEEVASIVEGM